MLTCTKTFSPLRALWTRRIGSIAPKRCKTLPGQESPDLHVRFQIARARGAHMGFNDFAAFCDVTKDFFPTSRLVTGHDHPAGGIDLHPEWKTHPALTLKGYGFSDDYDHPDAFQSKYQKNLVIARCRRGDIPEPILIPVDYGDLADYFENEISRIFKAKQVESTQPAESART